MSVQSSCAFGTRTTASLPAFDSLLHDFPGMAYRCLNDACWSMQYVSTGVKALTGYAPEALIENRDLAFSDLIHIDYRKHVRQEIDCALVLRNGFALTYRIVTADGTVKLVTEHGNAIRDAKGQVLAVQGFVTDVTALNQTQQALDELSKRFEYIAQATNDAIWDWNLRTNALWRSNGFHTMLGLSPCEAGMGIKSWTDLVHPDDKDEVLASLHEAIASKQDAWTAEYRLRRKDESYADVLDRAFIIRDAQGTAIRMVGGVSDLTECNQAKLHLERLNRALRMLSQCNEQLVRAADEHSLLAEICQVIVETGGYRAVSVSFVTQEGKLSLEHVAGGDKDQQFLQALDVSFGIGQENGGSPVKNAPRTAPRAMYGDIATSLTLSKRHRKALLGHGYLSTIVLPLSHDSQTVGVLAIYLDTVTSFDVEEAHLLKTLADNVAFGLINLRSWQERKRIEMAAVRIAAGVSASTGEAFFTQLAHNMAQASGADAAFVARFKDDAMQRIQTVTALVDNRTILNFEYEIVGSPCQSIITSSSCIVLDDVAECFPASGAAKMGMRGYVGCRLDSVSGRPLGLLFVLFRGIVPQVDFVAQTIQVFAARAGAELERQLADARIQEQASLLDKAKDAIVVHNACSRVTFWNKGAERLYGMTAENVLGKSITDVVYGDSASYQAVATSLAEHNEWQGEVTCQRSDGGELVVDINSTLVRDAFGNPNAVLSIITDITRRKAAEREVTYLAFHDRVTGLPNRHALMKQLEQLVGTSCATAKQGALLWIDLDRFKALNDTRGHDMGDLLLRQVGARISALISSGDTVARFGGDEFVVLIADLRGKADDATAMAKRLLQQLSKPFDLGGDVHCGSASVGLAFFRCGQDVAAEILKRADIAMYDAKAAGGNTLRLFDTQMQNCVDRRAALENDLRHALQRNALDLAYQPQVAENGEVTGAEALLRWDHPTRGFIPPSEFIPLTEATGLIIPFGEWVLEQACVQLQRWESNALTRSLSIAVNVSARQIWHPGFVSQVMDALRRTGADPHKLKLELTESVLVTDTETTVAKMKALKALGIRFSLDDFGTGFSSLSYLKRLPLDQLKIDRSFVADVIKDPNASAIARTVIALGKSLNLEVIAEGVETQPQRQFLATHGCTAYQGYLFSKPLCINAFEDYLRRSHGQLARCE